MSEIKLTLLENGYNFLNNSLSQAVIAEEYPDNWKYAILHLVQAIELTLKELLRREHPSLIFKNIDKPNETVSLSHAANRLENIAHLQFSREDLDTIFIASKYRNQIVHYEFSFKKEEIKLIYAKLLGFMQSIIGNYFDLNLNEIIFEEVWEEALKIIDYANELNTRAQERIKNEKINDKFILNCNVCHQHAFVFKDSINTCYACGHKDWIEKCRLCGHPFFEEDLQTDETYSDELFCTQCIDKMNYLDYKRFPE